MKHTEEFIRNVAENLSNYNYYDNLQATKELMDLLDTLVKNPLTTWKEYVRVYDNNFFTYQIWEALIESEKDQTDGLTEEECMEQLNKTIWQLPCGWYVQYV